MRDRLVPIALLLIVSNFNQKLCGAAPSVGTNATLSDDNVRQLGSNKWVRVCTQKSCDELTFDWPQTSGQAVHVVTSRSGKIFQISDLKVGDVSSNEIPASAAATTTIRLTVSQRYQSIMGWGASFTDAAAMNVYDLDANLSSKIIESYFADNGLQYNFGRVPIAGSDFSPRKYTYDDVSGDLNLKHWSLADEDTKFKIPMIREASKLCSGRGSDLKLIASPWSAPSWMKTSASLVRGALIDQEKYYVAYTEYLIKFYRAYREQGIEFWGATVQNEPFAAFLPFYYFNSMNYTPTQMIKFITNYLGPALEAEGMGKDKFKLIIGDDSLGLVEPLVTRLLNDERVHQYVSGVGFHWYTSGILMSYDRLNALYEKVKDKIEFMIMTEACSGSMPFSKHVDLGSWDRADAYAVDIIQDMLRHTRAWIDWNMALDLQGGPNWSGNFVDSPIVVDKANSLFYKQPMYYVLAHFSRFIKPGSVRIGSKVEQGHNLQVIAMKNDETGHVITNILNRANRAANVVILVGGATGSEQSIPVTVEGKSINSVILKL